MPGRSPPSPYPPPPSLPHHPLPDTRGVPAQGPGRRDDIPPTGAVGPARSETERPQLGLCPPSGPRRVRTESLRLGSTTEVKQRTSRTRHHHHHHHHTQTPRRPIPQADAGADEPRTPELLGSGSGVHSGRRPPPNGTGARLGSPDSRPRVTYPSDPTLDSTSGPDCARARPDRPASLSGVGAVHGGPNPKLCASHALGTRRAPVAARGSIHSPSLTVGAAGVRGCEVPPRAPGTPRAESGAGPSARPGIRGRRSPARPPPLPRRRRRGD